VHNIIINHGMVFYMPVNYPEVVFTMILLLLSLTVMALVRSFISVNMMHQEDMLMQKRKEEEGVLAFIKRVQVLMCVPVDQAGTNVNPCRPIR
jgi:hypothetical protein